MTKIILFFIIAFVLDVVWQNLHVFLYDNYKGGEITQFILLRAVLFDAVAMVVIALPFLLLPQLKAYDWSIIPVGVVASIGIEYWGLWTGRWAYNSLMPIIPILQTGLTPTIQLGLISFVSLWLTELFVLYFSP